ARQGAVRDRGAPTGGERGRAAADALAAGPRHRRVPLRARGPPSGAGAQPGAAGRIRGRHRARGAPRDARDRGRAARRGGERSLEVGAPSEAASALEELAAMPGIEDGPAEALACLETLDVPLWRGPSDGHVRVTSPYRIRARR